MNEQSLGPRPDADSDQQTGRLLEDWLRDEAPTHAPPITMPNARARIALTRRRPMFLIRDWWRWRPGRSNGGFRRMNAVTQLAAVAVLALSGFGLFVVASGGPTDDPIAPTAAWDPEGIVARVSGEIRLRPESQPTTSHSEIAYEIRGIGGGGTMTADDPRLVGTLEWARSEDDVRPGLGGPATNTMALRAENDSGAWEGLAEGVSWPDGEVLVSHLHAKLDGSGAYEGQSAYLLIEESGSGRDFGIVLEGLIIPGGMPAAPALP